MTKPIIKIILCTLALLLLAASIPVGYILMLPAALTSGDIPHKSDEELIANFVSHRAEFDRMLQMIREDKGLSRVDDNWTAPENPQTIGVSEERIDEYRSLFRRSGVFRGFSAFENMGYVEFIASAQGFAISGSSKGYLC